MATIDIDTEALQESVAEAFLKQVDASTKDAILKAAILSLGKPAYPGAHREQTRIQQAFDDAVYATANRLAKEVVESDPAFQEAVSTVIQTGMAKAIQESSVIRDAIANAISGVVRSQY